MQICTGTGAFGIGLHGSGGPKRWGGGAFGPCPPKANHRGPTYLLPPKPKPDLLDPLGPIAEVDFYQISGPRGTDRAPRDGSGPAGRIRALQNEPRPRGMDPQDESGPRKTDLDP